ADQHLVVLRAFRMRLHERRAARLAALRDRLDGGNVAVADRHEELVAVVAQELLHALDGVTLLVEHVAYALDELDVLRAIVAPPAAALQRLDLSEAGFPET